VRGGGRAALLTLHAALAQEGGTIADSLADRAWIASQPDTRGPSQLGSSGPRTRGRAAEYELLLEMILEGSLLHYGRARVVRAEDPDLALLLGDQLYALGLSRLAALGDARAVGELGDLIALVAQAHVRGEPRLAEALWCAAAVAVGWGSHAELDLAKDRARSQDPDAAAVLERAAASHRANVWSGGGPGLGDANLCQAFDGSFNEPYKSPSG